VDVKGCVEMGGRREEVPFAPFPLEGPPHLSKNWLYFCKIGGGRGRVKNYSLC